MGAIFKSFSGMLKGAWGTGRTFMAGTMASRGGGFAKSIMKSPLMIGMLGTVAPPLLLQHGPMGGRLKQAGVGALSTIMTAGMSSATSQALWSNALMAIPAMPGMFSGLVTRYRSGLDARTSGAIPFSHSTLPMDQALASLSYGQSRMGDMGSGTEFSWAAGNAASFMAARYMSR